MICLRMSQYYLTGKSTDTVKQSVLCLEKVSIETFENGEFLSIADIVFLSHLSPLLALAFRVN